MLYRRLGSTGLQLSALSFGAWVTFGKQIARSEARNLIAAAWDNGINFSITPRSMRAAAPKK